MLSKGSVLVVDDEVNLCRILGAKLARSGFSVAAVHDGQQAIDKIREADFDVVLLDLILPKLDGLSALAEIRNLNNNIPVIVMTACESSEALETAKNHGVCAYINKPFDLDNLVELVQQTSVNSTRLHGKSIPDDTTLFAKFQPVVLEVLNGRIGGFYPTRIESRDDRTISLLAPVRDGSLVDISPRTPVRVGLAANDAFYSFNSYVLALKDALDDPVVVLDKPGVIYRTQRRQSPRYKIETDIRYGRISAEDAIPTGFATGKSYDISSSGIKVLIPDFLEPGELVYLETDRCGSVGPFTAVGEVLRAKESNTDDDQYVVAMRFKQLKGNLGSILTD
ncbi:MAG TPA: response regulator [Armatimonadota bacterium]|nr:response regulator [Armatimonadota bacterium]